MSNSHLIGNILGEFLVCVHTPDAGNIQAIRRISITNGVPVVEFFGEDGVLLDFPTMDWTPGPCNCCQVCYESDITEEACDEGVLTQLPSGPAPIANAVVEANPNGFTVNGLNNTFDGNLNNWVTIPGSNPRTGLVLRWNLVQPTDLVRLNLFNNFGANLSDNDGIASATLTLYNAGGTPLWTGALTGGNGPTAKVTSFNDVIENVSYFTFSNITSLHASTMGFREVEAIPAYRAQIVWDCPGSETITADIVGESAGITYDGTNLVQTNGPHTFTFSSSAGPFEATLDTNNPAAWTQVIVSDDSPETTLSGNGSLTLSVVASTAGRPRAGYLMHNGDVVDANTGEVVEDAVIVPCIEPEPEDHLITTAVIPLCDQGVTFLRHIRLTRDGVVLVTNTTLDGRTAYTVLNEAEITYGECEGLRIGEACYEAGPQAQPITTGLGGLDAGGCRSTSAANPTAAYSDPVTQWEGTFVTEALGARVRITTPETGAISASSYSPVIPIFPNQAGAGFVTTVTVGPITVTLEVISGSIWRDAGGATHMTFGAGDNRLRWSFSPNVTGLSFDTTGWPNNANYQWCDIGVLPSLASDVRNLYIFQDPDGTIRYLDSNGEELDNPVIVSCVPQEAILSLRPKHKNLAAGVDFTPADVDGALTSLTYTVITNAADNAVTVDGVTINDIPAGYSATWSSEDENSLVVPTLIDAGTGGRILVNWVDK